ARQGASRPSGVQLNPAGVRVDVEATVADEADDGLTEPLGGRDREAGRRRHRAEHGNAGNSRLLYELEGEAPGDEQHLFGNRQLAFEQRVADQLVERVVTTHVLAHGQQLAVRRESGSRVQATRLPEDALVPGERV